MTTAKPQDTFPVSTFDPSDSMPVAWLDETWQEMRAYALNRLVMSEPASSRLVMNPHNTLLMFSVLMVLLMMRVQESQNLTAFSDMLSNPLLFVFFLLTCFLTVRTRRVTASAEKFTNLADFSVYDSVQRWVTLRYNVEVDLAATLPSILAGEPVRKPASLDVWLAVEVVHGEQVLVVRNVEGELPVTW